MKAVRFVALALWCSSVGAAQTPGDAAADMQAIARALGVSCDYCHTAARGTGAPEPKPEPKKDIAREMIAMTRELNARVRQATGNASAKVECVTCHRGVPIPRQLADIIVDTLRAHGADAAVAQYRELRQRFYGRDAYDFSEEALASLADRIAASRPDDAIALMKLNLEYNPASARSYAIIGYAYTRKFDDETAAVYYKKALEIEPNNSVIQGRLASLASSKGRSKEEQAK
jgi:cytochrome c-type biogenesis protein CcmH/NrfG